MLRLRTLGGLTIEDENGPLAGAIARKRSLALLALVGLGTEQGLSRDRVLAYLWPESDTDRARNNLKQTLFQLRQDLHEDVFARSRRGASARAQRHLGGCLRFPGGTRPGQSHHGGNALPGSLPRRLLPPRPGRVRALGGIRAGPLAQRYAGALETLAATAAGWAITTGPPTGGAG